MRLIAWSSLFLLLSACEHEQPLFQMLPPHRTGIDFANTLTVNDSFNAIKYEYIYHGAGLAAGDFNNDGLTDLFFSGNQVSSRLYLNRGDLRFEDATTASGLTTDRWCTGASVADVNNDGRLDIYVAVAGFDVPPERMANLLFINEGWNAAGIPRFREAAQDYGLADSSFSIHAAFLDYDLDGDLDCYVLNNGMEPYDRNRIRPKRVSGESHTNDRLYENRPPPSPLYSGVQGGGFHDVTHSAGILIEGYGLGVTVSDLNLDGRPDVYVANDFLSNDLVWINNGPAADGSGVTFTNRAPDYLKHQSHNGMGVDVADLDNDGLPEVAVLDMLPRGNYREKIMLPKDNYDKFRMRSATGYEPQYVRNTLQWNRGFTPEGEPRFSDVAFQAGVAATDWSWAVLLADLDNDGYKDVFISNGYRKDITNLDYVSYSDLSFMFGTQESKDERAFEELEELPEVEIGNFAFRNRGDLTFADVSTDWGLDHASFANGAVYADFDNDGDLDLAVNNLDGPASLYENRLNPRGPAQPHFLKLKLQADSSSHSAYNSRVWLYADGRSQYLEYSPCRGYMSSMDGPLHFGLGEADRLDSLVVRWPDGRYSRRYDLPADQTLTLRQAEAEATPERLRPAPAAPLFTTAGEERGINYHHRSNDIVDFKTTRTLPHILSRGGPALATGDIDGDGREDFFLGGDLNRPGYFFLQQPDGRFLREVFPLDSAYQDAGALLFDGDGDGDLDLYVASGGTHVNGPSPAYQDRLYLNDGAGRFQRAENALPPITASGSAVAAADYDGDGDLDLFIGGRVLPGSYPLPAESYLLRNEAPPSPPEGGERLRFTDVTDQVAPALRKAGLVTCALWTDYDGDGAADLLLAGEWMPITFFRNIEGKLVKTENSITQRIPVSGHPPFGETEGGVPTEGWWNSLAAADFDADGDTDYVLGNLGLNSKLRASPETPVQVYAADFDNNGAIDPVMVVYNEGKQYPLHARDVLIDQIPGMKRRFTDYTSYANATFSEVFTRSERNRAEVLNSYEFRSVILENLGEGSFRLRPLPAEAQLAPLNGIAVLDLNGDPFPDLVGVGNFIPTETTLIGSYDASYGLILLGGSGLEFQSVNPLQAGFVVPGDARSLARLSGPEGEPLLLAGQNDGPLLAFAAARPAPGSVFRPQPADFVVEMKLDDGRSLRRELCYGEGYLSQSSRTLYLPPDVREIRVRDYAGRERRLAREEWLAAEE